MQYSRQFKIKKLGGEKYDKKQKKRTFKNI